MIICICHGKHVPGNISHAVWCLADTRNAFQRETNSPSSLKPSSYPLLFSIPPTQNPSAPPSPPCHGPLHPPTPASPPRRLRRTPAIPRCRTAREPPLFSGLFRRRVPPERARVGSGAALARPLGLLPVVAGGGLVEVRGRREDLAGHDSVRGLRLQPLAHHHGFPQGSEADGRGDGRDVCPDLR